jgi:hypothetical protein
MTAGRHINTTSQNWGTPLKYVNVVKYFFDGEISLDPCSNCHSIVNAKVEYKLPQDGLKESWNYPTIFVNPPYGSNKINKTTIKDWIKRCSDAHAEYGSEVLALIPVATNTKHWKYYIFGIADCICFLYDTRLKFLVDGKEGGKGAPMACAMVYWGQYEDKFYKVFKEHGYVVNL